MDHFLQLSGDDSGVQGKESGRPRMLGPAVE